MMTNTVSIDVNVLRTLLKAANMGAGRMSQKVINGDIDDEETVCQFEAMLDAIDHVRRLLDTEEVR